MKEKCVAAVENATMREVYENVFVPEYGTRMAYETFRHKLRDWKKKAYADGSYLACGTFPDFTAHDATVQIDRNGQITQVWVKQQADSEDWNKIREIILSGAKPVDIQPTTVSGKTMLEIPLFDMHFGVATLSDYHFTLSELLGIITEKQYDEINIIIGQDVLHNNDLRGHTAKGTEIQRVNFPEAWADAWSFFCTIIDAALNHSPKVRLHYSKGNHDECSAWCFFKALEAIYPLCLCDDSLAARKCILWNGCFIGFGHCEYTKNPGLLFQNFVVDFPTEFSEATVREIHAGHYHRESIDNGIMVRRLASAVPTDEWSNNNGYVGAHKRFQIFEWAANRLKATYYI